MSGALEPDAVSSVATPKVVLSSDEPSEVVVAVENYMPKDPSSLGFSEGQRAMVLEKAGGWWFVRIGEEEGWVPGGFFEPLVTSPSAVTGGDPHLPPRRSPQSSPLVARKRFTDPDVIAEASDDLAQEEDAPQDRDMSRGDGLRPNGLPQPAQNITYLKPRIAASSSHSPDTPRRRARSPKGMEDLASQVWYHGQLSRADAELLLLTHGTERDFLIRQSPNRVGNFAISVKHGNKVRHFPVESQGSKLFIGQHYYDKMTEIVKYYMSYPLFFLEEEGISLGAPVKKL